MSTEHKITNCLENHVFVPKQVCKQGHHFTRIK